MWYNRGVEPSIFERIHGSLVARSDAVIEALPRKYHGQAWEYLGFQARAIADTGQGERWLDQWGVENASSSRIRPRVYGIGSRSRV